MSGGGKREGDSHEEDGCCANLIVYRSGLPSEFQPGQCAGHGGQDRLADAPGARHREQLRKELGGWPQGMPVILEGTFGWGWMSDELRAAAPNALWPRGPMAGPSGQPAAGPVAPARPQFKWAG